MNQYVDLTGDENVYSMVLIRVLSKGWFTFTIGMGQECTYESMQNPLEAQREIQSVSNRSVTIHTDARS